METLPIFDIHQAAFLSLNGITPNLTKSGTRVIFEFDVSKEVTKLLDQYNRNPDVRLLDYVSHLRRLRSKMLALRE